MLARCARAALAVLAAAAFQAGLADRSWSAGVSAQPPQARQAVQVQVTAPGESSDAGESKPPAVVFEDGEAEGILGRDVLGRTGEKMGRIIDVIVDRRGRLRAAIVDFGGFLGVGSRKIAIDWRVFHIVTDGKTMSIVLDLTREDVKAFPEYRRGEQVVVPQPGPSLATPAAEPDK
jgi:sporulation protein YlmC with PRC-barrel domain